MLQTVLDEPFLTVLGRIRSIAPSQGWVLVSGGLPADPTVPMFFRQGLGSFRPSTGLQVALRELGPDRTRVDVTAWRGTVVVDGPDAQRMIRALNPAPR